MQKIEIHQIGPLTFQIDAPLSVALVFVEQALSKVEKSVITPATGSKIEGQYKFGGGDLFVSFAFNLTEITEQSTRAELRFAREAPAYRTDMIRNALGRALCETYDPQLPAPNTVIAASDSTSKGPRPNRNTPTATQEPVAHSSDYKTTSGLGSFFSFIGWLGVGLSLLGGLVASDTVGFAGIAAGFIAAFFCLLTVAAGQLLRAQIEIANNSRLIVLHLDRLGRASS